MSPIFTLKGSSSVEASTIIEALMGLVLTVGGFIMKNLHSDVKTLESNHSQFVQSVSNTYARRDDVKELNDRIFTQLDRIENKLDRKQDKSG